MNLKISTFVAIKHKLDMMTSFWNGLGDIFTSIFSIMPTLGNIPNYLGILIISVFFIYWTKELIMFKRNGDS
ncbi:MAG: DUF6341 family protein [Flavobacteriales bacterium]